MSEPACLGRPEPYDTLMDYISGPEYRTALETARSLCGACPISATCLRDNIGERWANAVLGRKLPAVERESCGSSAGAKQHYRAGEETCEPCKAYQRGANAKRREARDRTPGQLHPRRVAVCGTESGYKKHLRNGEPTCAVCRDAQCEANTRRRREQVAA